jgi:predicted DNA-binding transcriptional regulator AlpA
VTVERYVRRPELAERMGLSVSTIDRLVKAGMPSVVWGARSRRFLISEAVAWAKANGHEPLTSVVRIEDRRHDAG